MLPSLSRGRLRSVVGFEGAQSVASRSAPPSPSHPSGVNFSRVRGALQEGPLPGSDAGMTGCTGNGAHLNPIRGLLVSPSLAPAPSEEVNHDRRHPDSNRHPQHGPPRRRSLPGRLGSQGDDDRRGRDAGPHGHPQGICHEPALEGRAHRRLPAHDHPDRRAHRDPGGPRRRGALGELQHLLDPGPRRRRHRPGGHSRLRLQGREPPGLLGLHPPHLRVPRRHRQHDPGRRRRRHPARPPGRQGRGRSVGPQLARKRGGARALRRHQGPQRRPARLVQEAARRHPGRHRRDHHGRPPAV